MTNHAPLKKNSMLSVPLYCSDDLILYIKLLKLLYMNVFHLTPVFFFLYLDVRDMYLIVAICFYVYSVYLVLFTSMFGLGE